MEVVRVSLPLRAASEWSRKLSEPDPHGDIYLQVGDRLLQADEKLLRKRGKLTGNILDGAREKIHRDIGKNVDCALTILTLDTTSLYYYLRYIYAVEKGPGALTARERIETYQGLVGILKSSTVLGDHAGWKYAISRLDKHPTLSPGRRYFIAREFLVPDWFDRAVPLLLLSSADAYDNDDYRQLCQDDLKELMGIKFDLIRFRLSWAKDVPSSTSSASCLRSTFCQQKWEMMWREFAVPFLIAATVDIDSTSVPLLEIEHMLFAHRTICNSCYNANMDLFRDSVRMLEAGVKERVRQWRDSVGFNSVTAIKNKIGMRNAKHPMAGWGTVIVSDLTLLARHAAVGIIGN